MRADRLAPFAQISLSALGVNVLPWQGVDAVADLRADACGHGAEACAIALAARGFARAVVDDEDRRVVADAGLTAVEGEPDIVPEALFGLTGVGEPVMRFRGIVLGVKPLLAGEGVSYGYHHRARADTRIALVSGGYAQGVVRSLGGVASVTIAGRRHPIVGRVAMDVCVVDVGDADVVRGDQVAFFGERREDEPTIAEWTDATGMRPTELVTAVGLRAHRVVVI